MNKPGKNSMQALCRSNPNAAGRLFSTMQQQSSNPQVGYYIGAIFEVGVLPDSSLLAGGGG